MDVSESSQEFSMRLDGRVAIITGASRGIGREMVRLFARAGAAVVFCARTAESLSALEEELRADGLKGTGIRADVGQSSDVAELVARTNNLYGRIDILVNNTGVSGPTKSVDELTLEEWQEVLAVNLTGAFLTVREVVPEMRRLGSGSIVNIGSIAGKAPLPLRLGYAVSKMGLLGMTRTLAGELGAYGIRVNHISPGAVRGERLEEVARAGSLSAEELFDRHRASSPLGELVEASSVASMALYLCTDLARHLTGQDINVTAGAVMY
jgi:NAD(P)-dependent dehydrogenase (short-subunit alcohol dehydrogenase family)